MVWHCITWWSIVAYRLVLFGNSRMKEYQSKWFVFPSLKKNGYKFNWNQNQGSACNSGVERNKKGLSIIRINSIIFQQMYFQVYPEQQHHMQKSNSRSLQKYKLRIEHLPYLDDSLLYSFHSTESLWRYLLSLSKPALL